MVDSRGRLQEKHQYQNLCCLFVQSVWSGEEHFVSLTYEQYISVLTTRFYFKQQISSNNIYSLVDGKYKTAHRSILSLSWGYLQLIRSCPWKTGNLDRYMVSMTAFCPIFWNTIHVWFSKRKIWSDGWLPSEVALTETIRFLPWHH